MKIDGKLSNRLNVCDTSSGK